MVWTEGRLLKTNSVRPSEPPARLPTLVFLGSLAWQKGVHVLIEAFNQLPATYQTQAALTVYGGDRAFPDYGAQLRRIGCPS